MELSLESIMKKNIKEIEELRQLQKQFSNNQITIEQFKAQLSIFETKYKETGVLFKKIKSRIEKGNI